MLTCVLYRAIARAPLPSAMRWATLPLLVAIPWRVAEAQRNVTVYWAHSAQANGELSYRLPGDDESRRRGGLGSGQRLTVRQGAQVCFRVVNANPLLYTYAAGSKVVSVAPPEGLSEVVGGVQTIIAGMGVKAGPPANAALRGEAPDAALARLRQDSTNNARAWLALREYAVDIQHTLDTLKALDDLRLNSDSYAFDAVIARARELRTGFAAAQQAAVRQRTRADSILGKEDRVVVQLRALEAITADRFAARLAEFEEANARRDDPLCATVDKDRLRLSLTTKSRGVDGANLRRVVAEDVVAVELDPQSDVAFEVAPGVLVGVGVKRQTFSLVDGVVRSEETTDAIARPALFALGRLWPMGWLWAGMGVAQGSNGAPDAFLGIVLRPSVSLAETQLSVGAGLGYFQVADRLKAGQVGESLPPDVGNLDDNIERKGKVGLAITVNISGLKFGTTPK